MCVGHLNLLLQSMHAGVSEIQHSSHFQKSTFFVIFFALQLTKLVPSLGISVSIAMPVVANYNSWPLKEIHMY